VIEHADRARAELFAAVDAIPEPLREARPTLEQWSAAEVLEHLARVEKGIAKLVALKVGEMQAMADAPRESPEMVPVDLTKFTQFEDRATKREAPERVRPSGEISAEAARAAMVETRGIMLDQLHAADGLALSQAIHQHPFLGALDLYEWVYFVGGHELRHVQQVRDIATHFATS
jgi:DinB superfamily